MGIKNLFKFLRTNCPEIFEEIHLSEYSFKKVAIDVSLYLCKFKIIFQEKWLHAFVNLVSCLRRNEVHCVFIYDSGAPPEKEQERKERSEQRAKTEERVYKLEEALEKFHLTSEVDPIIVELWKKRKTGPNRLLRKVKAEPINMRYIEEKVKKMSKNILRISDKDFELTKKLFDILKVPYFMAPLEAETMCASLCKRGIVDAALTEDSDVLAYGSPIFLHKLNTAKDTCLRIKHPEMLESLKLSESEFLDFCIMCGTDYNKNIFRVGPQKAYKYIQEHSTIEKIGENTNLDIGILNHVRGRELFRDYERKNISKVLYCGSPDFNVLNEFVVKHNIQINIGALKKAFTHNDIVVIDSEDEEKSDV